MARVFLTGATGFVGSFVAKTLCDDGHEVHCLVRKSSNLRWIRLLPCQFVEGTLVEPESYRDSLKKVTHIIHVAGVTKSANADGYYRGNFEATRQLYETARAVNPALERFLFVSSQAAVGPTPPGSIGDETIPYRPLTDYGRSKMMAEQWLKEKNGLLPLTIVRPPAVFGPRDTDVLHFFKNLNKGWNIKVGNIDQLVSIVYVEDLARGIVDATFSSATANQTYFLADPQPYLWSEFTKITANILKVKYRTLKIPYRMAYLVAAVIEWMAKITGKPTILNRQKMWEVAQPNWAVSVNKAIQDFGYHTQFSLEEAVRKTLDWYRDNNWI
ncbi:MAG: NAD(P)-dependent oxidoreductase [Calditrichia bacterium]